MKNLEVRWSYELREGERIIRAIKPRICHSFLKQFGQVLYGSMSAGYIGDIVDTGGTTRTINYRMCYSSYTTGMAVNAATSNSNYGIQVGTGSTAPAISNYALQTKIAHGTGVGQLQYAACTVGSPSATSTQATFKITRVFTNGTANPITVEEIGLVLYDIQYYYLVIRDITGGIAVAASQSLTVNYDLTTTI